MIAPTPGPKSSEQSLATQAYVQFYQELVGEHGLILQHRGRLILAAAGLGTVALFAAFVLRSNVGTILWIGFPHVTQG